MAPPPLAKALLPVPQGGKRLPPVGQREIEEGAGPRREESPPRTESVPSSREGARTGEVPGGGDVSTTTRGDASLGGEEETRRGCNTLLP